MKPLSTSTRPGLFAALALGTVLFWPSLGAAQAQSDPAAAQGAAASADYPKYGAGVLIEMPDDWIAVDAAMPSKTRTKGGLAQAFSYGAIRGSAKADYDGEHAACPSAFAASVPFPAIR
jgi:hypothetical protein